MAKEVQSIIIKSESVRDNELIKLTEPTPIEKESKQIKTGTNSAIEIAPIYPFSQLLNLYKMNTYHQRAMRVKAALTCLLGFNLFTDDTDKTPDKTYNDIMDWLKSHSSYAGQPIALSLFNFCLDYEIYGNAALEIVRNKKGLISEVYHLPMKNCVLKREYYNNKRIINLIQKVDGKATRFWEFSKRENLNENEYIIWKNYSPLDDWYGVPEYLPALAAMVLDYSATRFNINRFDNNMVIESIITVIGAAFGDTTEKNIRDFFKQNFKGVDNAGKSLLLQLPDATKNEVDIKIEKIASEIKEASYRLLRQDNKEEIIAAHGVPPRLVGIMNASQLGGTGEMKEQMRMFRDLTILPRQMMLEYILNELVLSNAFPENKKWKIKFDTFDISDAVEDADYYYKIMQIVDEYGRKPLTSDEIREEQGYPPRKDKEINVKNDANKNETLEKIMKIEEGTELLTALIKFRDILKKSIG